MSKSESKLAVLQVAALGWDFFSKCVSTTRLPVFKKTRSIFPAVTCPVQATVRTGLLPSQHGMVANGRFFRDLRKVLFWEQASPLVEGRRVWEALRHEQDKSVAMMFWQQSLGEDVDFVLSPRPIHKHEGGMIQDCHSLPESLYAEVCQGTGKTFNLMHYWGPLASAKSSRWIVGALDHVMQHKQPDLMFGYLPHLDYDLQRFGPNHKKAVRAAAALVEMLEDFIRSCEQNGYDYIIYGDYEIGEVSHGAVFPNRRLNDAGLFKTRTVQGMQYPDFFHYEAFAMVDHEVAHVYVSDPGKIEFVRQSFTGLRGVSRVWLREEADEIGLNHPNSGELILLAEPGAWFAYPWWNEKSEAPDYATHIDIHNKPGYDPCELFFGWPPMSVTTNTSKVKGTHGRSCDVAWATSLPDEHAPENLAELGELIGAWRAPA